MPSWYEIQAGPRVWLGLGLETLLRVAGRAMLSLKWGTACPASHHTADEHHRRKPMQLCSTRQETSLPLIAIDSAGRDFLTRKPQPTAPTTRQPHNPTTSPVRRRGSTTSPGTCRQRDSLHRHGGKEADGSRERVGLITINRPREKIWTVETHGTNNAAIKEVSEQSNKSASDLARGGKRRSNAKRTRREKMERAIQRTSRL